MLKTSCKHSSQCKGIIHAFLQLQRNGPIFTLLTNIPLFLCLAFQRTIAGKLRIVIPHYHGGEKRKSGASEHKMKPSILWCNAGLSSFGNIFIRSKINHVSTFLIDRGGEVVLTFSDSNTVSHSSHSQRCQQSLLIAAKPTSVRLETLFGAAGLR